MINRTGILAGRLKALSNGFSEGQQQKENQEALQRELLRQYNEKRGVSFRLVCWKGGSV